jgi:hypothetical protein
VNNKRIIKKIAPHKGGMKMRQLALLISIIIFLHFTAAQTDAAVHDDQGYLIPTYSGKIQILLHVPHLCQFWYESKQNSNCVPVCGEMEAAFIQNRAASYENVKKLNTAMGKNQLRGGLTDFKELQKAMLKVFSLRLANKPLTVEEIVAQLGMGRPVIIVVDYSKIKNREDQKYKKLHAMIVLGCTEKGLICNDPDSPSMKKGKAIEYPKEEISAGLKDCIYELQTHREIPAEIEEGPFGQSIQSKVKNLYGGSLDGAWYGEFELDEVNFRKNTRAKIELMARQMPPNGMTVLVNGKLIGQATASGKTWKDIEIPVKVFLLKPGINKIIVSCGPKKYTEGNLEPQIKFLQIYMDR